MGPIVSAIGRARQAGLTIPILSNCSGWQKLDILRLLEGIIDIYLVDMRYADDEIARNCSGASRYKEVNRAAVKEMYRQVGNLVMDKHGIATRGILVRHLVLPGDHSGSEEIFRFLAREVSSKVYVSLMSQYFPAYKAVGREVFGRRITPAEFDKAVDMFYTAGLENGFIQEMEPTGA
jgi:putative pyruvate formate lyase activating enzyme